MRRHRSLALSFAIERRLIKIQGPVAQWIRHRPTEPGIADSSPAGVRRLGAKVGSREESPTSGRLAFALYCTSFDYLYDFDLVAALPPA